MLLISILAVVVGMVLVQAKFGPQATVYPAVNRLGDWLILAGLLALVTLGELARALGLH